jgi:hypothetical protein
MTGTYTTVRDLEDSARQAHLDYRRDQRKARKFLTDAEDFDLCAIRCDKQADWWEARAADPGDSDHEEAVTCAANQRKNAEAWRRAAASNRRHAPDYREFAASSLARYHTYERLISARQEATR